MLSLLKFLIKWFLITFVILTLGNWIRWNGESLSDRARSVMAPYEKSHLLDDAKKWAKGLTQDAKQGVQAKWSSPWISQTHSKPEGSNPSERQKLRTLIRELSSTDSDKD